MKFINAAHRDFFEDCLQKSKTVDCYHEAFFYIMGTTSDTRSHINSLFDFKNDSIKPDGLHEDWQTGASAKACRLAFNLWNGYTEEEYGSRYTPEDIFANSLAPYFMEGIKLRYPEYCRDLTPDIESAELDEAEEFFPSV